MARDLVTEDELVCPKCKMFGCDCDAPRGPSDICPACRRNKQTGCQCASHVPHIPTREDVQALLEGDMPWRKRVEAYRQAFRHHYYDTRDAAAIERMVVHLATESYRR